jgi:hypothetical protein
MHRRRRRLLEQHVRLPRKCVVRILLLEPSLPCRLRFGLLVRRHLRERRLHVRAGRELLIHLRGAAVSRRVRRSESVVRRHLCGRHVRLRLRKQLPFSLRERPLPRRLSDGGELRCDLPEPGGGGHARLRYRLVRLRSRACLPGRNFNHVRRVVPIMLTLTKLGQNSRSRVRLSS